MIYQRLFCALALLSLTACATRLDNAPVVDRSGFVGTNGSIIDRQPSLSLPPGYDRIKPGTGPETNAVTTNVVTIPSISATPVTDSEVQTQLLNGEPSPTAVTSPSSNSAHGTNNLLPTPVLTPESAVLTPETAASFSPNQRVQSIEEQEQKAQKEQGEEKEQLTRETITLAWPVQGPILSKFNERRSKGLNIGGSPGTPIRAAAGGRVVYAGNGLRGYGNLIIVKHDAIFLSAYAHNRALFVREGDIVAKGQKIAEMGNSDASRVMLHFEVRRQGKPIDPLQYLSPR